MYDLVFEAGQIAINLINDDEVSFKEDFSVLTKADGEVSNLIRDKYLPKQRYGYKLKTIFVLWVSICLLASI